jgi:hypothetical protein
MSNHIAGIVSAPASAQPGAARGITMVSCRTATAFGSQVACPTRRSSRPPGTWRYQAGRCRPASA